jgi:hypothetical protein
MDDFFSGDIVLFSEHVPGIMRLYELLQDFANLEIVIAIGIFLRFF